MWHLKQTNGKMCAVSGWGQWTGVEPAVRPCQSPWPRWGCGSLAWSLAPLGRCTPTAGSEAGLPATCLGLLSPSTPRRPPVCSLCLEENQIRHIFNDSCRDTGLLPWQIVKQQRRKDQRKEAEMYQGKLKVTEGVQSCQSSESQWQIE